MHFSLSFSFHPSMTIQVAFITHDKSLKTPFIAPRYLKLLILLCGNCEGYFPCLVAVIKLDLGMSRLGLWQCVSGSRHTATIPIRTGLGGPDTATVGLHSRSSNAAASLHKTPEGRPCSAPGARYLLGFGIQNSEDLIIDAEASILSFY